MGEVVNDPTTDVEGKLTKKLADNRIDWWRESERTELNNLIDKCTAVRDFVVHCMII